MKSQTDRPSPTDTEIVDWLCKLAEEPGIWIEINFSNSWDMGYRKNFISVLGSESVPTAKGNSVREALAKAMRVSKNKPRRVK